MFMFITGWEVMVFELEEIKRVLLYEIKSFKYEGDGELSGWLIDFK